MASTAVHSGPEDSWHGIVSAHGQFPPEKDRYHMYVGLFCPFTHRANLVRHLKGLQSIIPASVVMAYPKGDDKGWPGWKFPRNDEEYPGATVDHLYGSDYLHKVYFKADKGYKGRYTVPALWDKKAATMVSSESAELMRWMQYAFNDILPQEYAKVDLYPQHLRKQIDEMSEWIQRDLNSGVYKAGFAPSQEVYNKNLPPVFAALNQLEEIVHKNGGPYILGTELTELDVRVYATIIRFDVVYVQHFKCNLGTIRGDYPNLHEWLKNLYWNVNGFKETTDFRHIKENVSSLIRAEKCLLTAHSIRRATQTSTHMPSLLWALIRTSIKVWIWISASCVLARSLCPRCLSAKQSSEQE